MATDRSNGGTMKLTKEWIRECATGYHLVDTAIDEIWKAVQEDREELRKEILKDHFMIGESLDVMGIDGWVRCEMVARLSQDQDDYFTGRRSSNKVRRPPKTRPLTRDEKI